MTTVWLLCWLVKSISIYHPEHISSKNYVCIYVCLAMFDSLWSHELEPTMLLCPWDFPGKNTGVGCHPLLQGIFPTQESNPSLLCLLHCRQILYHWATVDAHICLLFKKSYIIFSKQGNREVLFMEPLFWEPEYFEINDSNNLTNLINFMHTYVPQMHINIIFCIKSQGPQKWI